MDKAFKRKKEVTIEQDGKLSKRLQEANQHLAGIETSKKIIEEHLSGLKTDKLETDEKQKLDAIIKEIQDNSEQCKKLPKNRVLTILLDSTYQRIPQI